MDEIVKHATELAGVHTYAPLLDDADLELAATVRVFAAGTWRDAKQMDLLLTPAQTRQLQRLTVVSLAQKVPSVLFDDVSKALDMSDDDILLLLTEVVELGMVRGRIDAMQRRLDVFSCMPREVLPDGLAPLQADLHAWRDQTRTVLAALEDKMRDVPCPDSSHAALVQALYAAKQRMTQQSMPTSPRKRTRA